MNVRLYNLKEQILDNSKLVVSVSLTRVDVTLGSVLKGTAYYGRSDLGGGPKFSPEVSDLIAYVFLCF